MYTLTPLLEIWFSHKIQMKKQNSLAFPSAKCSYTSASVWNRLSEQLRESLSLEAKKSLCVGLLTPSFCSISSSYSLSEVSLWRWHKASSGFPQATPIKLQMTNLVTWPTCHMTLLIFSMSEVCVIHETEAHLPLKRDQLPVKERLSKNGLFFKFCSFVFWTAPLLSQNWRDLIGNWHGKSPHQEMLWSTPAKLGFI